MEGFGELRWPNGKVYFGNFLKGNMHGKGKLLYQNGEKY